MISAIKKGDHIGLLLDQPIAPEKGGIPIHFIHSTTYIAPTAALLAYRTQSPSALSTAFLKKRALSNLSI